MGITRGVREREKKSCIGNEALVSNSLYILQLYLRCSRTQVRFVSTFKGSSLEQTLPLVTETQCDMGRKEVLQTTVVPVAQAEKEKERERGSCCSRVEAVDTHGNGSPGGCGEGRKIKRQKSRRRNREKQSHLRRQMTCRAQNSRGLANEHPRREREEEQGPTGRINEASAPDLSSFCRSLCLCVCVCNTPCLCGQGRRVKGEKEREQNCTS